MMMRLLALAGLATALTVTALSVTPSAAARAEHLQLARHRPRKRTIQ
jgi:hypothetical protein